MKVAKPGKVLVTGCAGFIGFHVSQRLLQLGREVLGLDNLSPFYDEGLKAARLALLKSQPAFEFVRADLADRHSIEELFRRFEHGPVVHLAAQAGVRHSLDNPQLYVESNVLGFVNLIEECRKGKVPHFVYASSSSVYGANRKIPFCESDNVDHPVSLYAATKKSDELIAHVYAHLYGLPVTGLRFFTVYGPWGRPDMAIFKFCKAICEGTSIELYNYGQMQRDFTYIDDVVEGIIRILDCPPAGRQPSPAAQEAPSAGASPFHRIYNIGNNRPVKLTELIQALESKLGKKAILRQVSMQPGDVLTTYADIDELSNQIGYRPRTTIQQGIDKFVDWYNEYYRKT
jgi:UDP-glucuronate 4-epimerase